MRLRIEMPICRCISPRSVFGVSLCLNMCGSVYSCRKSVQPAHTSQQLKRFNKNNTNTAHTPVLNVVHMFIRFRNRKMKPNHISHPSMSAACVDSSSSSHNRSTRLVERSAHLPNIFVEEQLYCCTTQYANKNVIVFVIDGHLNRLLHFDLHKWTRGPIM